MKRMKKVLSLALALALAIGCLPNVALAAENGETGSNTQTIYLGVEDVITLPGLVAEEETIENDGVVSVLSEIEGMELYEVSNPVDNIYKIDSGKYFIRHYTKGEGSGIREEGRELLTNIATGNNTGLVPLVKVNGIALKNMPMVDGEITWENIQAVTKELTNYIWTIDVDNTGYFTIRDINEKYINISNDDVILSSNSEKFKYTSNKNIHNESGKGLDRYDAGKIGAWTTTDTWEFYTPVYTGDTMIEALKEGTATITVGDITYTIVVRSGERHIQLKLGEEFVVIGEVGQLPEDNSVIEWTSYEETTSYTQTALDPNGGEYLIGRNNRILTNEPHGDSSYSNGLLLKDVNFSEGSSDKYLWTVKPCGENGGYTIQYVDGAYMYITHGRDTNWGPEGNILLGSQEKEFAIAKKEGSNKDYTISCVPDGKSISYELNPAGSNDSTTIVGWGSVSTDWYFYKPERIIAGVKFTAVALGNTEFVVDGIVYHMTVAECEHSDTITSGAKDATCTEDGATGSIVCTNEYCNAVIRENEVIPASGHAYSGEWAKDENNHWHVCANGCGVAGSSAAHNWEEASTELGKVNYVCSTEGCGATKSEVINVVVVNASTADKQAVPALVTGSKDACTIGEEVTMTASVVTGYTFLGWYTATVDENGAVETIGTRVSGKTTYTATVAAGVNAYVAVYEAAGKATVTVNVKEDVNSTQYDLGTEVTVTADATNFAGWQNAYGVYVSRDANYTFTVTGNVTLTAVYNTVSEDKVLVIFESHYGQELAREELTAETAATYAYPTVPARYGYTANGWTVANGEALKTAVTEELTSGDKVLKITPVYTADEQKYTVSVTGGTLVDEKTEYKLSEIVRVKADAAATGKKFSHWADAEGNVLSYNESYSFYLVKEVALTAVYVDAETTVAKAGVTEILAVNTTDAEVVSFVSLSTVPQGYKIHKAGVIAAMKSSLGSKELTDKTAQCIAADEWSGTTYRYTLNVTRGNGGVVCVRAYLVYEDDNHNVYTVYGDVVEQDLAVTE